jgi:nickel-type superoxide dismutase maturation protease
MCGLLKVTGHSLSPLYEEGDFVLVIKTPFFLRSLKSGDIIVFHHPLYGTMIKQVDRISTDGDEICVIGTHPESTDSRQFGPVPRKDVVGKVIWHIRKVTRD